MNEIAGRFEGLPVMEARKAVAQALKEKGLLVKVDENYRNRVGKCYKCGTVIEPMLLDQWFVKMEPLAKKAIQSLEAGAIKFYPDAKKDQLIGYLKGLRDWNISRQIAWGIPIPAFQNLADPDDWIFDERVEEEELVKEGKTYRRDPDVFDTWFSSSSWPYATLDYPQGDAFKNFYPLSLMETGGEILYPWVSRMIMLGLYVTGEVPFKSVYIHGYVMAEDGSKMSKSIGNVIDLTEVIENYGSDAFRMGIVAGRTAAVNRGYDSRRVEEARNFCNKLWNIARYVESQTGDDFTLAKTTPKSKADHWMLSKLQHAIDTISSDLDEFRFAEAYEKVYHLVWDDFADWYIEASKTELNLPLLSEILQAILIITHPFAPFVTETIWQTLPWTGNGILATESWPNVTAADKDAAEQFEELKKIVTEVRNLKTVLGLSKPLLHHTGDWLIETDSELLKKLAGLEEVSSLPIENGIKLTGTRHTAWLAVDKEVIADYLSQLKDKKAAAEQSIQQLESRLKNKSYVENAPERVVKETRAQLEETNELLQSLEEAEKRFQ
jgi:valyl-tRNA synthetase